MEVLNFLKALYRRKFLLIIIPVITIIITFFLVRNLPNQYVSKSRISTGITDASQQVPGLDIMQESAIGQEFGNLTQLILQKQTLDQVSYLIIIHDLTSKRPFRPDSKLLAQYSKAQRQQMVTEYTALHQAHESLVPSDPGRTKLWDVLKSMNYDDGSLRGKLRADRVANSDFIDLSFESENPEYSAFVANTLATEFIDNYQDIVKNNRARTSDWLSKLLAEKLNAWKAKMDVLKNYKIQNHILKLDEQAKALYGQIADYESRRQVVEKDILGLTASLQSINNKFEPRDRKYLEGTMTRINEDILDSKAALRKLQDEYIRNDFDNALQARIDSVKRAIEKQILAGTDKYIFNPLTAKTQLVAQKLQLEVDLEMAQNSVVSVARELDRLNNKLYMLVPHEANIQSYETDLDVASREYLDILNRWNEFNMEKESSSKIRQVETALPGTILPSKKMLLIILSGIISLFFCVLIIFILFLLDHSVRDDQELANKSEAPVLGKINQVRGAGIDLRAIWTDNDNNGKLLKKQLRALRFEIENELAGKNILAITSLEESEGKTFVAVNLAYAWAMTNKKVLLIDGHFGHPSITGNAKPASFIEDVFTGKAGVLTAEKGVTILGNRGGDSSLMELTSLGDLSHKIRELAAAFDIIIIDTASLEDMDKAKEWIRFAEKTLAVFETGNVLAETDLHQVQYLKQQQQLIGWVLNKA
ncbi:exopolysaccharide transport family protein [Filimonas effusa]|uniref:Lipopolysaccharide biosynthesis protein n=1 Tax=Filimonas effusa TaxID=2508721 RepID=A0A4Q1D3D9_9BACT|nr:lipopolysaccharide biosynthesis protein [Filimonas effusa]RXK81819.1 lipopolysaccharide biosynthesis protein [Filimonas effusa]